ncbi:hypothetical protein F5884DRAFT_759841 [Xylogone sp. PMI_703]|nr:hypothetical protein F5884DRAFT_759841 [Xylogone sp. PMI_703]
MDQSFKFPGSPGTPLHQISPERVNQRRSSIFDDTGSPTATRGGFHSRESSVHDKVAAFNSLALKGKDLERKTNDAALRRAMLGREEAESEMRRYKEEVKALRKQVEEGKEREKKVGERLESVMENYGRAKETHAHTQTLWEKEIRRAKKESFKSQSAVVKLQEELKASRNSLKRAQADIEEERERSTQREREAFAARYQAVGLQEELVQLTEKIKHLEQERDALKTIAKNEEIARIAAEGRIPLPSLPQDDEFASPKKKRQSRSSISYISSAVNEELEEYKMRLEWEKKRADKAHEHIEFLELECRLNCCTSRAGRNSMTSSALFTVVNRVDKEASIASKRSSRPSHIFVAEEGIFKPVAEESPSEPPEEIVIDQPSESASPQEEMEERVSYARTPSCEPPSRAVGMDGNTSLLSLLDAPHHYHQEEVGVEEEEEEQPARVETFHTISTTTRIPLADPDEPKLLQRWTFDSSNPALISTMTKEEALAQIRERRGRAKSLANGTLTPRKQMVEGGIRRDVSAPDIRV